MAIISSVKFRFLAPVHDHEFSSSSIPPNRVTAGTSTAKIAIKTLPERNASFGSKLLNFDASERTRVQELIDQLHCCAENWLLKETRIIHGNVIRSDFSDDNLLILLNHLMHAYSKCSDFKTAKIVFNNMPKKNVFSWSVIIVGSNKQEFYQDGLNYFCQMMNHEILPDGFAYSAILQSCIGLNSVDLGNAAHAQIIIRGFVSHVIVCTTLLNMYAKLGKIEEAYLVFDSMGEHNDVSWNAMISGLTSNGLHMEAFDHFIKMKEHGFVPNMYTLVSVLKAVAMLGDLDKGKEVHECVSELDIEDNILVGTALIDMYSKCGDLLEARFVFDTHFADRGVNAPWNAMISGYSLSNCSEEALQLYIKMCRDNIKFDIYTYCSVFDAIAHLKCLRLVKEVHGLVLKSGCDLKNLNIENAIADAYSKCGSLDEVKKIFNGIKYKDIVSWTTLLTAYSQCSKWEDALVIFSQMREEGFVPNQFTLASVLTACANLCYLEYGRQIHVLLWKYSCETVRYIESALIDMYAKGGSIDEAEKVFNTISDPDIVSLTAIISGYAYHGYVANALWHFKRMEQMRIKPTAVTLLCVLYACSHGGLVEEGLRYFWSMEKNYGLVPKTEHYACVVDLLGRAGQVKEAFEFITKMPFEPDEMVWQSLLAACRTHGNVEFGEIAAKKILSLYPEYSSTYILLSKTYMKTGSIKDGVRMRNVMKEKGVKKEPGHSWISVEGRVHTFYAGDANRHPQIDDIYTKLEELTKMVKSLGYIPDLYALQDQKTGNHVLTFLEVWLSV